MRGTPKKSPPRRGVFRGPEGVFRGREWVSPKRPKKVPSRRGVFRGPEGMSPKKCSKIDKRNFWTLKSTLPPLKGPKSPLPGGCPEGVRRGPPTGIPKKAPGGGLGRGWGGCLEGVARGVGWGLENCPPKKWDQNCPFMSLLSPIAAQCCPSPSGAAPDRMGQAGAYRRPPPETLATWRHRVKRKSM